MQPFSGGTPVQSGRHRRAGALVPPAVTEQVGSIVSRWRRGEQASGKWALPDNEAQLRDELYLSVGGPLIAAFDAVGDMVTRWQAEPENRALIDREIIDLAHTLGWKPVTARLPTP